jgi:hypothetical protein
VEELEEQVQLLQIKLEDQEEELKDLVQDLVQDLLVILRQ